ncbi:DUF983 domain-containing protein [Herpetosiphon gulosus]|jgi:uncharacterized protein (DUF983 family)|uniref:DUF983 domain-containing protein n=1 Tax=Herpetosiphon gulosus TaxID=1973496 RepID=A0ABP9WTE6_9CHLR
MGNFLLAMLRGFIGRCPLCGKGKLFRSYYDIHPTCSACGVGYEATGNQSTGAMGINIVLTIFLGFIGGIFLVIYASDQLMQGLLALLLVMSIFHIIFYRFARGLWLGLMVATGDLETGKDERG